ncbi:MAG TPA: hypothetical protein VFQ77_15665 [Pseudonocardiaceae bacterium]|nr:hypothetical protein [Pseudonocardiaceae bacterium]
MTVGSSQQVHGSQQVRSEAAPRLVASWLLPVWVLGGAALLVLARLVVVGPVLDRVWAEDGAVFWTDAKNSGLGSFGLTYSGYLHVFPRLVTSVVVLLPEPAVARSVVVAVALTTGVLAALVFAAARALGMNLLWATAAGWSLALVPRAGVESIGNLANVQWLFLACLAWLSVTVFASRALQVAAAVVAGLTALSTPLAVLVVPALVIVHGWRGALRHPVTAPLLTGLAIQALAIIAAPESPFANPAVRHPGLRLGVIYSLAAQVLPLPPAAPAIAPVLVVAALVLAIVVVASTLPARRAPFLGLVLTAALLLGTVAVLNGWAPPRYWVAPTALVVGAAGLWLTRRVWWAQTVALAVAVAVAGTGFPADPYRLSGPSWAAQAQAYRTGCAHGDPAVELQWSPAGWGSSRVACR